MSVRVRPRADGPRSMCPFCREDAGADVTPCACGVSYHPECRAELSRCVTIGCAGKSAAPGQRGAHRDVACVRCQGLINNDGDMCFGCWSPFHRRCLADGCCACPPSPAAEEVAPSLRGFLLATVFYLGSLAAFMLLLVGWAANDWLVHPLIVHALAGALVWWAARLLRRSRSP